MIQFPNISPEIFTISLFGMEFALRWYALAYIAGLGFGWQLIVWAVKRPNLWPGDKPPMEPAKVEDLLGWVVMGVIAGGRLGFVLFYQPDYYLAHPLEILKIWQGGMSFHGGLLGVIVAGVLFCRTYRIPMLQVSDAMAFVIPVGLFFGRLSNFVNAELWGRPTQMPWGVVFPGEAAQNCPNLIGLCARHPSQLYEAGLEGLMLGAVVFYLVTRRQAFKRPGLITGMFFAGYGLSRFIVEFFRQPDAQFVTPDNPIGLAFHINGVGLTMGQTLSLPMIAVGVGFLFYARRRA